MGWPSGTYMESFISKVVDTNTCHNYVDGIMQDPQLAFIDCQTVRKRMIISRWVS